MHKKRFLLPTGSRVGLINPNVAKLKVTKLQIAQREIDTCVDLYFSYGDLVSTHLLISAAHEILAASKTEMLFDNVEQYIKPEYLDDFRSPLSDPIPEDEVKLELQWTADERAQIAMPNSRDRLEVEVVEVPASGFKVRAAWLSGIANYAAF